MIRFSNKNRGKGGVTPPRQRKSIRLPGYNYTLYGYYFITICSQDREVYFENNDVKQIIDNKWQELKNKFANIDLDEYVIMPNHLHGIIVILNGHETGAHTGAPLQGQQYNVGADLCVCPQRPALGTMIQWFKTITTNYYIQGAKTKNWTWFAGRLWQRNYYEHIIRNNESLNRIRYYIKTNPENWRTDRNNPKNIKNWKLVI